MANNSNNVNRYVSEISVYYLYLILKVLAKFIYNKYEIEINNEEVDLLEKELKSDFLHSTNLDSNSSKLIARRSLVFTIILLPVLN